MRNSDTSRTCTAVGPLFVRRAEERSPDRRPVMRTALVVSTVRTSPFAFHTSSAGAAGRIGREQRRVRRARRIPLLYRYFLALAAGLDAAACFAGPSARAASRAAPSGVPRPVHGSQPG